MGKEFKIIQLIVISMFNSRTQQSAFPNVSIQIPKFESGTQRHWCPALHMLARKMTRHKKFDFIPIKIWNISYLIVNSECIRRFYSLMRVHNWCNCWNILSQQFVTGCQKIACQGDRTRKFRLPGGWLHELYRLGHNKSFDFIA